MRPCAGERGLAKHDLEIRSRDISDTIGGVFKEGGGVGSGHLASIPVGCADERPHGTVDIDTLHVAQPPYILHGNFTERRGWLQPSSPHAGVAPAVSGRPVRFVRAVVSVTAGRIMAQIIDAVRMGAF